MSVSCSLASGAWTVIYRKAVRFGVWLFDRHMDCYADDLYRYYSHLGPLLPEEGGSFNNIHRGRFELFSQSTLQDQ